MRRRKIDRDRDLVRPRGGVAAGLPEHPFAERHDQPDFLGDRNEFVGTDQAALRMVPAQQRLEAADLAARKLDQRLIVELEFVGEQRLAQVELQPAALLHLRVHLRLEEMIGAAAVGLGAIERHVGVAQQLIGLVAVGRRHGNADAGADDDLMAVNLERLQQRFDDLGGKLAGLARAGLALHDGKFVAAEARDRIDTAHHALQALGHRAQQRVADGMTERIVDALEAVKVEEHHRQPLAAAPAPAPSCRGTARDWASRSARHAAPCA